MVQSVQLSEVSQLGLLQVVRSSWKQALLTFAIASTIGYGAAWLIPPTYSAKALFIPPQGQTSSAAMALGSLGALAGLAGGSFQIRTPGDQFLSMLNSDTVVNAIIKEFALLDVYEVKLASDARKILRRNTNSVLGKRDGLISVEVEDSDPKRAAAIANAYIRELQSLAGKLTITEAQQRRKFFELQLEQTKINLTRAQAALERSGFSAGALRVEPRIAAETYGRISAEVTATEVRLSSYRSQLQPSAPEIVTTEARLAALKRQLDELKKTADSEPSRDDYVGRYREFKYQEALFDLFAKQFEAAKLDESKEGNTIQVIDSAQPPDRRARPVRLLIALATGVVAMTIYLAFRAAVSPRWRSG